MLKRICKLLGFGKGFQRAGRNIVFDQGSAKPTDGTSGYAVQSIFIDTTNGVMYINEGTATSCSFSAGEPITAAQELLLGATAGTAAASKAVILDASKDVAGINDVSLAGLTSSDLTATTVVLSSAAKKLESSGVTPTELNYLDGATAGTQVASKAVVADANINSGISKVTELHIGATGSETQVTSTAAELNILDDVTADKDEINFLDGATAGTQVASKAVIADANINTGISKITELHIGATGSETQVTSTAAELNILDDVTADKDEINFLDGATAGTQVASKAVIADANINSGISKVTELHVGATGSEVQVTATPAEINQLDDAVVAAMTPGTGISTGSGTVCGGNVVKVGPMFKTEIFIDLTGLNSGSDIGDIIGKTTTADCHIGQITAAKNGTIHYGQITCLETPAGGDPDVDFYGSVTESTGTQDGDIASLTGESQLLDNGDWTGAPATPVAMTALPGVGYLYMVDGGDTAATYTAGQFLVELWGE